jgi:predicted MFS family arabinose efflux permease
MVIVNTVVYVQSGLQRPASDVPIALGAFGFGSMLLALLLPRILDNQPDRPAMLIGASLMAAGLVLGMLFSGAGGEFEWFGFLLALFVIGIGYSMTQTPSGRLLRRSSRPEDRPAVFAAQFSLSHACWLMAYPLAGQAGIRLGMTATFGLLAAISATGTCLAWWLWPRHDQDELDHEHPDDPRWAHHLETGTQTGPRRHSHDFTIDSDHPKWPTPG